MNCARCDEVMDKMTVCHQICPNCGSTVVVTDATLTDDSGDIQLTLWGDDNKGIKIGSKVSITNGYTNTFKDVISLTKGKFGQLEVVE